MKVDKGRLRVADQELADVVLWRESAPNEVELTIAGAKAPTTMKIWNVWRDDAGTMQAWIGNSGMVIDREGDSSILHCSDGSDGFDPTALLARVSIA